jgi:hypothetical protein
MVSTRESDNGGVVQGTRLTALALLAASTAWAWDCERELFRVGVDDKSGEPAYERIPVR